MVEPADTIFVSYAGPDRAWAEWVAWHLHERGHTVELDVWNWAAGDSFVQRMSEALERANVTVALFSNSYFIPGRWTNEEWASLVGRRARLVPVVIEPLGTTVPALLADRIRSDLYGLDEAAAVAALVRAVAGPTSPTSRPPLPDGMATSSGAPRPRLPTSAGLPRVWNVGRRNPQFTGREDVLTQLRDGLLAEQHAAVQALHGLGGIGKTQTALEYAHRFASQYDTVWWIDAEQADQIPVHYTELADRLGIAAPEAGAEHNARLLLSDLRTRDRWLIILDNADDPRDVDALLPTGPGHVLITSRNSDWHLSVPSRPLGVFTRPDSLAYLTARMPGLSLQQADLLADDLGDLPLALAQAAGVIATGMTVDRYRQLLADKTAQLLANGQPPGYTAPLAATVDIATSRLDTERPEAAALLRLCAFLGPDPIPTAWLEHVRGQLITVKADPDDFMWPQNALQHLARYGLARIDHESFQIHRLTQAILRAHTPPADATPIEDDVAAVLTSIAPDPTGLPSSWPQWAVLTSHLTACQHMATERPRLRGALLRALKYLPESGQARAAHELAAALHRSWAGALGKDQVDTLAAAYRLATAQAHLGQNAEARRIHEDVLERRKHVLGDDHPDTLNSANNLANTLGALGEYPEARRMHEDVLERRKHVLGDDHPLALQSAANLASALRSLGLYVEARRMHEDVLERSRRVLGENHPATLTHANNLASTIRCLGVYAEARRMHEDVLERRKHVLGDDHPDTLNSANNLAGTLGDLGEHAEARRIHEDVLERSRRVLGDDHPDALTSANNLAGTLGDLGEHAEARRIHEDVLERSRRVLGDNHPDTLTSANNLANTLGDLGEHAEARRMHEDVLERRKHVLGDDHPDTLTSANNLASTLGALGVYAEARRMHEDVLERRKHVLGDDHPDTLNSAFNYAIVLGDLREHAKATSLLRDLRAQSCRTLGNDHPLTHRVTKQLARALTATGRPFEANKLLAWARPGQTKRSKKRRS